MSKSGCDPERDKARDLKRQRKIACDSSDKAGRRNIPRLNALGNRKIRRADRADLASIALINPNAETILPDLAAEHSRKWKSWGSDLAASHRVQRAAECAYLDQRAGEAPADRRCARPFHIQRDAAETGHLPAALGVKMAASLSPAQQRATEQEE